MLNYTHMTTTTKQLPKSEILLTIEVPQEKMDAFETEAAHRISEQVEIAGFRKGQAPKAFVIAQVGADAFFQEVLNVALPRSYLEAVQEHKLEVISRPEIKVLTKSPLKYEAKVGLLPAITLKGYEKIKIDDKPTQVNEKEIDEVIEEMRKYRAGYKPIERPIRKGDRVEIDFEGFDEKGVAVPRTKSENHPLFIGEGVLVPGFEEQLVDMKKGEKKKFPVKFPKDYHHEPLKNQIVHFDVTIKRSEEAVLPELNDEFVSEIMGQKKSVAEFREAVKSDMRKKKSAETRRNRENELLEKLLKDAKFDVPPTLIEEEIDYMVDDLKHELEHRGMKFEDYAKKLEEDKRNLRKEFEPEAEKRIRIRLILNFLFREMSIAVTDEEMNAAIASFLAQTPEADHAKIKAQFDSKKDLYLRLKNNLMLEKLFAKFLS